MAALLAAQHVAGATQLQIECSDLKARAEIGELLQRCEPTPRDVGQLLLRWNQQVGIRSAVGASHTSAKLVELGQSVAVCPIDHDGVGQRNVDAVLDDG